MADVPLHRVSLWLCEACLCGQIRHVFCDDWRCALHRGGHGPLATDPPLSAFRAAKENEGATVASIERERDEFRAAHMAVVAERDAARADLEIDVHVLRAERDDAENDAECKRAENARLREALEDIREDIREEATDGGGTYALACESIANIARAALATPPVTVENLTGAGRSEAPVTTGGGQAAKPATPVGRSREATADEREPPGGWIQVGKDYYAESLRAERQAGYDAATADVVAWLLAECERTAAKPGYARTGLRGAADALKRGDHVGAAARAKGTP